MQCTQARLGRPKQWTNKYVQTKPLFNIGKPHNKIIRYSIAESHTIKNTNLNQEMWKGFGVVLRRLALFAQQNGRTDGPSL
jgi:hypothetical protein